MPRRPEVIAFDVFKTLFPLEPLRPLFQNAGLPPHALELWFAQLLRNAMATEITGQFQPLTIIASATLAALMESRGIQPAKSTTREILDAMTRLPPHPDVAAAFEMLSNSGLRLVTLSNGSEKNSRKLLKHANLYKWIQQTLSVDGVKHFKPSKHVYLYAAKSTHVRPKDVMLIAAHDWDLQGAASAGLSTGFVDRGQPYSFAMPSPDLKADDLPALARQILDL